VCKLLLADCLEADWSFPGWTTGHWESGRTIACSAVLQSQAAGLTGPDLCYHRHACLPDFPVPGACRPNACFAFMQALVLVLQRPPPVPRSQPPPQPNSHPSTTFGKTQLKLDHDSMQSILSDVETTERVLQQTSALPASSLPHPSCSPFTVIFEAHISAFALSPLFCLCTTVNMQLSVTGSHSAAH